MGQLPLAPVNRGGASSGEEAVSRPDDGLPHAKSHHPESRGGHTGGISEEEEHPRTIAHRLNEYTMGWLKPDATTKARLAEVIVVEWFLECLAPEPQLWVQRQAPATLDRAVALAEQYQAAERTPARLPGRSTAGSSAPPAPDRAKGLGGRGVQGFGRPDPELEAMGADLLARSRDFRPEQGRDDVRGRIFDQAAVVNGRG
ncbi:Zinc finger protein 197 [Acipenser ruthenus]|uniref:Zinc finger protein 197 n=1 Tax=Acipenser ruthenus TaxID=7906 RepID=A0A662YUQ2_ACIRT|nr:Zinc finger protein 197 [Acipenser ruthenus]